MRTSFRRLAVIASATGVLAMLAGPGARAAGPPQLVKPVNATKADLNPQRTYSAPDLKVNPDNSDIIVGGFIEFRARRCGLVRSTDAGRTWKILESTPEIKSQPYCLANNSNIFHAPVAWGRDNALYLATHAWDETTRTQTSVILAKSTDLGDTWTTVFARDARTTGTAENQENDRPVTGLVVDAKSGSQDTVYVLYRRAFTNRVAPNAAPQEPVLAISRDGGKTFDEPVSAIGNVYEDAALRELPLTSRTTVTLAPGATTTVPPAGSQAAQPNNIKNYGASSNGQGLTIDDKGNVYVAYMSEVANVASPPRAIMASKSTDKGKTWTSTMAVPFSYEQAQNVREAWTPGGGPNGTLHMVWEWRHPGDLAQYADVGYIRSTDGGKTWSQPKTLADDDPKRFAPKYLPMLSVSPNGRIDAAWWDTRDDPGIQRAQDVYYAYSDDDGQTWSKNIRVTDQTIDRRFGVWGNNFDQNSPPGLASTNQFAVFAWDDTRLSRGEEGQLDLTSPVGATGFGGGVQDIFVSAVQFEELGGGTSRTAQIVLAGVVGILAVGLILLAVGMIGRRGDGAQAPATSKGKTGATVK
ncbi:MAG TPA: sialidase family protein [Acidimicrobiales bacterium]|nr:sialidase family protein [Acidimicrobiales bacterium]